jgi:hypothetical protein
MSGRRLLGMLMGMGAALASLSVVTPPSQSAGGREPAQIGLSLNRQQVSPNGDGRKDAVVVRLRLPAAARATMLARRIGRNGEPVLKRIDLDRRPRGATTWRFDGRDARGKVLPDGYYEVAVAAHTARGRSRSRWVRLRVDTEINAGLLRLDWPSVYPRTPDVVDTVSIDHLGDFYEWLDAGSFVILDSRGNQVAAWAERPGTGNYCTLIDHAAWCGMRHDWDGRLDGEPLPAGTYELVMTSRDGAGNRATRRVEIEVSDIALVARQGSVQAPADGFDPPPVPDTGCNGCGEELSGQCGSVTDPGRFGPGSLRYASKDTCDYSSGSSGKHQAAMEHAGLRGAAAAYGPWTVTASGGASTPGEPDVGRLITVEPVAILATEGTVTSSVVPTRDPGRSDPYVRWRFETRGTDSVDVAWFRLDYTYYALP